MAQTDPHDRRRPARAAPGRRPRRSPPATASTPSRSRPWPARRGSRARSSTGTSATCRACWRRCVDREARRAVAQLAEVLPDATSPTATRSSSSSPGCAGYLEAVAGRPGHVDARADAARGRARRAARAHRPRPRRVVAHLAAAMGGGGAAGSPDPELTARMLSALSDEAARLLLTDPATYPPSGCWRTPAGRCAGWSEPVRPAAGPRHRAEDDRRTDRLVPAQRLRQHDHAQDGREDRDDVGDGRERRRAGGTDDRVREDVGDPAAEDAEGHEARQGVEREIRARHARERCEDAHHRRRAHELRPPPAPGRSPAGPRGGGACRAGRSRSRPRRRRRRAGPARPRRPGPATGRARRRRRGSRARARRGRGGRAARRGG